MINVIFGIIFPDYIQSMAVPKSLIFMASIPVYIHKVDYCQNMTHTV